MGTAQVETLLKNPGEGPQNGKQPLVTVAEVQQESQMFDAEPSMVMDGEDLDDNDLSMPPRHPSMTAARAAAPQSTDRSSYEMIGLGLEEAMPNKDIIDALYVSRIFELGCGLISYRHDVYFAKIHPTAPLVHRARYLAAMDLGPKARPAVCLRYAIWAAAAAVCEEYQSSQDHFYQRARKYAESAEMLNYGEGIMSLQIAQAWSIIANYEFRMTYFPRAWMSTGRGARLAQMMSLNRLDGAKLDVKQCLPPPRDWTEREERRRTFWMIFNCDRCASIGTGWPMTIDERDVCYSLYVMRWYLIC